MQKITPFLWSDGNLEDAVKFYTSIFKNSTTLNFSPGPGGRVISATFQAIMQMNIIILADLYKEYEGK